MKPILPKLEFGHEVLPKIASFLVTRVPLSIFWYQIINWIETQIHNSEIDKYFLHQPITFLDNRLV
jgi:hypothetical protein